MLNREEAHRDASGEKQVSDTHVRAESSQGLPGKPVSKQGPGTDAGGERE
jgi:hypothetical protein